METKQKKLAILDRDAWLEPSQQELTNRYNLYQSRLQAIERASGSIIDYANGYNYFGFQRDSQLKGVWFREWLPGAERVYLFGDFNSWQREELPLGRGAGGVWSAFISDEQYGGGIKHGSLVKILVCGENGTKERIPAYIRRVVQDETTKDFAGQVWFSEPFEWQNQDFSIRSVGAPLIYECHIGMAQEEARVGTYTEFAEHILPRIKDLGYNAIQMMGVAEHPYYGSFGYHVSNFFAPSSRFGTPEELKALIDKAHGMGIGVIMDLVHAHYVKNIYEGLNELDGTDNQYSPPGEAGYQPYWDSKLFDYAKEPVQHFLLSNVKYWLEEFHFDGYRFDGVTSMIYTHHGYTEFDCREKFFDNDINRDAICYLTLANKLTHSLHPQSITIAEDVSGMPAMCYPEDEGGVGFNYRLAMAIPDFWIKLLKEVPDEQWDIWQIWDQMTNRLPDVQTIAYCESHDQALVGDKTIAFRLMDKAMYDQMDRATESIVVDRGIALHKMIRLATITLGGQGYLNFMGNEFGHPEWIDFPREGNDWSYEHARRQWSLAENPFLRYRQLQTFDKAILSLVKRYNLLGKGYAYNLMMDTINQTMVYSYGTMIFVLNWSPFVSIPNYEIPAPEPGTYKVLMSSDDKEFGGKARQSHTTEHFSSPVECEDGAVRHNIKVYNISRTATVYIKQ